MKSIVLVLIFLPLLIFGQFNTEVAKEVTVGTIKFNKSDKNCEKLVLVQRLICAQLDTNFVRGLDDTRYRAGVKVIEGELKNSGIVRFIFREAKFESNQYGYDLNNNEQIPYQYNRSKPLILTYEGEQTYRRTKYYKGDFKGDFVKVDTLDRLNYYSINDFYKGIDSLYDDNRLQIEDSLYLKYNTIELELSDSEFCKESGLTLQRELKPLFKEDENFEKTVVLFRKNNIIESCKHVVKFKYSIYTKPDIEKEIKAYLNSF